MYGRRDFKDWFSYSRERMDSIANEIKKQSKDYILNVNEDDYKNYLFDRYSLEPLEIIEATKIIHPPIQKEHEDWNERERFKYNKYYLECKISFQFTGNSDLWYVQATTFTLSGTPDLAISGNTLTYTFTIQNQDPQEFHKESEWNFNNLLGSINYLNKDIQNFNRDILPQITQIFSTIKAHYLSENDFFKAINVTQINSDYKTYAVPVITKKKTIEKPNAEKRSYVTNPVIDDITYNNIVSCLHQTGASMEKKPSLYAGKGEEAIRDFFLVQLELRFEGGTTTGETFNRGGKTDILLRNTDGTNLFVGECKIWKGEKVFFETISQLLSYLTWQDSKTSILFFVKNESIVKVVDTVKNIVSKHENFIAKKEETDRSVSCIFKLPQDPYKQIKCEIILFHFEK